MLVRRNGKTVLNIRHKRIPLISGLSGLWSRLAGPFTFLVPPPLRSLGVDGWKRNYAPNARVTERSSLHTWTPSTFDVDQQAGSGFRVDRLRRMQAIRLLEPTIQLRVPTLGRDDEQMVQLRTFGGLALRIEYGLTMTTGKVLLDYLGATTDLSRAERAELAIKPQNDDED